MLRLFSRRASVYDLRLLAVLEHEQRCHLLARTMIDDYDTEEGYCLPILLPPLELVGPSDRQRETFPKLRTVVGHGGNKQACRTYSADNADCPDSRRARRLSPPC